jgi:DNA-binding NarL/FixJ family response regulator
MAAPLPIILLVEDKHDHREHLAQRLREQHPSMEVITLSNEWECYEFLASAVASRVRLGIFDLMLPWAEPSPSMPEPPDDVVATGYQEAGVRCARRLSPSIRSVVYSVIGNTRRIELPLHSEWIVKSADHAELLVCARRALASY